MKTKFLYIILFVSLFTTNSELQAQYYYKVTPAGLQAVEAIYDLRINDAESILNKELENHPGNHYIYYLLDYCNVFKVMYNPSERAFEEYEKNAEKYMTIIENDNDTSLLHFAALYEMKLYRGVLKIKFGEKFSGLRYAYGAYNGVYDLLEKYPGYPPLLKLDGMFNIAVSNMPPFVKFAVSFFGVSGNYKIGEKIMEKYYNKEKYHKTYNIEAALFMIFAGKLNKTPWEAYRFINTLPDSVTSFKLLQYFKANLAYRTGHNEEALKTLKAFYSGNIQYSFPFYHYLMGKILLRKLNGKAVYHFERFLSENNNKDYMKEINYKLALTYLLKGDIQQFEKYKNIACNEGDDITERDRETMYDCHLDYLPDINLTKAKLLLAGGYISKADSILHRGILHNIPIVADSLEFYLLKATLFKKKGEISSAVHFYEKVISVGKEEDYYFACEAALELGKIYEERNKISKARQYYELSHALYDSDYYEYLDSHAEKGLDRTANIP